MDETKKDNKRVIIQIIFLILLIIAIGTMISAILTVKNYSKMLQNPIGYNMEKFNLAYCTCYDKESKVIPIKSNLFNETFNEFVFIPEYKDNPNTIDWSIIK